MVDELALGSGERLPWLETAEEYDFRQRKTWTTVLTVLAGLAVLLMVIGGIYWNQRERLARGNGELITAPPGPYKVRAEGDDGAAPSTDSDAMLAASEGQEALGHVQTPSPAEPATPTPATPPEQPARTTGSAVQLGAFDSAAIAEAKWKEISGSQSRLRSLAHSVEPVRSGGKTVHRLRVAVADGAAAKSLCGSLQRGDVPCFVVR